MADQNEGAGIGSTLVGGTIGAGAVGGFTYNHLAKKKLKDLAALQDPESAIAKKFAEISAKDGAEKAMEQLGLKNVSERVQKLDPEKMEKALVENPKIKAIAVKAAGLGAIEDAAAVSELHFEQVGKTYTAHVKLTPEAIAKLSEEDAKLLNIKDGLLKVENIEKLPAGITVDAATKKSTVLTGEAVTNLSKVAEGAAEGTKPWIEEAKEATLKAEKATMEKEGIALMRSVGGRGWSWGNLTGKGKAGVVAATVAGVAAGVYATNAIFGGKHSSKVIAEQQMPEQVPARA